MNTRGDAALNETRITMSKTDDAKAAKEAEKAKKEAEAKKAQELKAKEAQAAAEKAKKEAEKVAAQKAKEAEKAAAKAQAEAEKTAKAAAKQAEKAKLEAEKIAAKALKEKERAEKRAAKEAERAARKSQPRQPKPWTDLTAGAQQQAPREGCVLHRVLEAMSKSKDGASLAELQEVAGPKHPIRRLLAWANRERGYGFVMVKDKIRAMAPNLRVQTPKAATQPSAN